MSPFVLKLLFFNAFIYASGHAETIKAIVTKTANCFQCGMIEDVGQLDIKICGDLNCCFVQHLDNSEINFQAGTQDRCWKQKPKRHFREYSGQCSVRKIDPGKDGCILLVQTGPEPDTLKLLKTL